MAAENVKFSQFPETTTLDDDDVVPLTDVSIPETKKITVANLRAALLAPPSAALEVGTGEGTTEIRSGSGSTLWIHEGIFVVGAGEVGPGLTGTIFFSDGGIQTQGVPLRLRGGEAMDLELEAGDGDTVTPGGDVRIFGGDGAEGTDGGDVTIDAGGVVTPTTGVAGSVRIGTQATAAIESGSGETPWTHDGGLSVTGDLAVANVSAAGGIVSAAQVAGTVITGGVRLAVESETGTERNASDADANKLITCSNASPITITVPSGLTPGVRIEYAQMNTGQVQLVAGGGMSLLTPVGFNPATVSGGVAVLTVIASNAALVRGDLEET